VGVEQHLVALRRVRLHDEGAAGAQLQVGHGETLRQTPPITRCSSLQSNWKASPGSNLSGT
jgi:hypothetical protein